MVSIETQIYQSGCASILSIQGRLVLGEAATAFRSAVTEMLEAGNRHIVLNFAGVSYADIAGIGALAVSFSDVKAAGGSLAVAEAQKEVRDVLEQTGLTGLMALFDSEREAVDSFAPAGLQGAADLSGPTSEVRSFISDDFLATERAARDEPPLLKQ